MKRRLWTRPEIRALRTLYPHVSTAEVARILGRTVPSINGITGVLGLHKSAAYMTSPMACRLRRGDNVGAPYRFAKGHVPANKGLRRPGWFAGRMRETQFKKGALSGAAQKKWRPVGTEVVDRDGYRKRKVSDDRTKPSRFNWRFVHVLVWERKHRRRVPPGHAVAFRDGDHSNIRPGNLKLITRRELMRRNSIHRLPKELAQVIQLRGAVVRQIRQRSA